MSFTSTSEKPISLSPLPLRPLLTQMGSSTTMTITSNGDKATAAKNIVKLVKSYGAKIDGDGLQAHFTIGQTPDKTDLASTLKSFTALDVEVAFTEMDVRMELSSRRNRATVKYRLSGTTMIKLGYWKFRPKVIF